MAKILTELDRKLLTLLRQNGRESFVNLADALDTSEATVRSRVKRLCDTGVIRQFTVRTTGANLKAMVDVVSDTHVDTSTVAETIAACSGVEVVYETSGSADLVVLIQADDTDELNAMVENIRKLPSVRSTQTRLILREVS